MIRLDGGSILKLKEVGVSVSWVCDNAVISCWLLMLFQVDFFDVLARKWALIQQEQRLSESLVEVIAEDCSYLDEEARKTIG